ncbi:MAG TPA: hypothetical protein VI893_07225, partial [Thermoplasmata archaeon]|nr:hypothetical protein [Thermoplasmata archaeon]
MAGRLRRRFRDASHRRALAQVLSRYHPLSTDIQGHNPLRAVSLLFILLLATAASFIGLSVSADDGPGPVILAAPGVNSFGIRRDVNGDLDCPPSEVGANVTDTQIDIGTAQVYCVYADIYDIDGWSSVDFVNVSAFYDAGSEARAYNQTPGANRNFLLNYTNTTTSRFTMRWPVTDEMTLLGGVDQILSGTNHELRWRMRFGNSVRWAPCTLAGPFQCAAAPTSSVNSWNAALRIRDSTGNVVTGPAANTQMEWGVYKLGTMTISASSPSGTGVPGGGEFQLDQGNPQQVSFAANFPYRFNVSICDLTTTGICGAATPIIPRQNIRIQGDPDKMNQRTRVAFPSTTGVITLNGTAACYNEFLNGTGTAGATVTWFAEIPLGTLEGTYSSLITYHLDVSMSPNICTQMTPDHPLFTFSPLVTDLSGTGFRLSWVSDRPAAGTLEISTSSTFATIHCTAVDATPNLASGAVLIATSPACSGGAALSPGTTYYWRARMVDLTGRISYYPTQT